MTVSFTFSKTVIQCSIDKLSRQDHPIRLEERKLAYMNWFRRFMQGRYGTDQLNLTILGVLIVLYIIRLFAPQSILLLALCYLLLIVYIYRAFSRNVIKRSTENARFLHFFRPASEGWEKRRQRRKDRKAHRYYRCPNCSQKIRVPKGKGKIRITCPKCRMEFEKKT